MRRLLIAGLLTVAVASCGTTTRTVSAPAANPAATTSATTAATPNADAWPRLWCRASVGMSRRALAGLMGLPTVQDSHMLPLIPPVREAAPTPPEPLGSDTWQAPGTYRFNAFYGGRADALYVQQLDFNGPASALPCATIRVQ